MGVNDASSPERPFRLFVSAGEASGDLHTANLLRALKEIGPLELEGFGGRRMTEVGVRTLFDLPKLALIGFVEVAKHLLTVRRLFALVKKRWREEPPDAILLTDFPGMHLRLAKIAEAMGIPVVYYISPQLWAWHESRVEQIRRTVRRMLVILPFEVDFYARHGIEAAYVGHPLLDHVPPYEERVSDADQPFHIGLLPGSRPGELKKILPVMLETARNLHTRHPEWRFSLPLAETLDESILSGYGLPEWVRMVRDDDYEIRRGLSLAWTASGTATVENAILGIPTAVLYKSHPVNVFLARRLVRVPYIGLVNLIAGHGLCPEFLQEQCRPAVLEAWTEEFAASPERQVLMLRGLAETRERLGRPGASSRAAREVWTELERLRGTSS